jgi:Flp pilus assembly protein TadG
MRTNQSGATAIELALLLPIFLLTIDGVIEFGLLMHDKNILHNAVTQAARAGIVNKNPKLDNFEIESIVRNYTSNFLISFNTTNNLSVLVVQSPSKAYQTPLTVSVSYTYSSLLGGSVFSAIGMPLTLNETVTFLNE